MLVLYCLMHPAGALQAGRGRASVRALASLMLELDTYMSLHAMDPLWPEESREPWIHLLREVTEDTGATGPAAGTEITNLANMLMLWESQVRFCVTRARKVIY